MEPPAGLTGVPLLGRGGGREGGTARADSEAEFPGHAPAHGTHIRTRRVFGRAAVSLVFVPSLVRPARGRSSIHLTPRHLTIQPSHLPPSHHPSISPPTISPPHHLIICALGSIALEGIRIEPFFFLLFVNNSSLLDNRFLPQPVRFLPQPVRFLPSSTQPPAWAGGDDSGDDVNPHVLEYIRASSPRLR